MCDWVTMGGWWCGVNYLLAILLGKVQQAWNIIRTQSGVVFGCRRILNILPAPGEKDTNVMLARCYKMYDVFWAMYFLYGTFRTFGSIREMIRFLCKKQTRFKRRCAPRLGNSITHKIVLRIIGKIGFTEVVSRLSDQSLLLSCSDVLWGEGGVSGCITPYSSCLWS